MSQPSNVTIMFTDLEAFTDMVSSLPLDVSQRAMDLHNSLMRQAIEKEHGGRILHFIGDAVFAVFDSAIDAARCALLIQNRLQALNDTAVLPRKLRVRVGLHEGPILFEGQDYGAAVSPHINFASRVMSCADGGQILLSETVYRACKEQLDHDRDRNVILAEHGVFYLKGIGPAEIFEIADQENRTPSPPRTATSKTGSGNVYPLVCVGYELQEQIGRGGMGVVFRALRRVDNSPVAVKFLAHGLEEHPEYRGRFTREVEAISRCAEVPGIVSVLETSLDIVPPYFVMELVDGPSITAYARDCDWNEVADLFATVCHGLQAAHHRGILHRDLKPSNILVTGDGAPILVDFGLHLNFNADPRRFTPKSALLGTPAYLSPEQIFSDRDVGRETDIYSLGVVLYEVLARQLPYEERSLYTQLTAQVYDPPPLSPLDGYGAPEALRYICLKAMEKDRDKRYQTAQDMAEDLSRFVHRKPVLARPSFLENLLSSRVTRHLEEVMEWRDQSLISESEFAELTNAYSELGHTGMTAITSLRKIRPALLILYVGAWLLLMGATIWLTTNWDHLINHPWFKMLVGCSPAVMTNLLWHYFWKRRFYRTASVTLVLAASSIPLAATVLLDQVDVFTGIVPTHGLYEWLGLDLTYPEYFVVVLVALSWALAMGFRTRTVVTSYVCLTFVLVLYALILDFTEVVRHAGLAEGTLWLLPLMAFVSGVAWCLLRRPGSRPMATPWMLTTIALVLLVPSSVAVTAPYDNDWWPSGSLIRIPIGLGISSAKKAYAVQALEETGAAYDASSVRSFLKSTTISPEQAQRDLDYTNYALNATARFATSWLLLSVVGMFFFAMGLALRHGWSIYGYSIHDKLLYAAPVTFLGGLFFLALAWPLWWFHIEIGGYLAPLPLPVCTFASLALAFTSSWISGRTNLLGGVLRMYVVTGLVFFALSVFLLGRIYLSGVESFGMWLFAFGLAFIAGFMVWHIRGGRRKEDVDERFDTLLRRH